MPAGSSEITWQLAGDPLERAVHSTVADPLISRSSARAGKSSAVGRGWRAHWTFVIVDGRAGAGGAGGGGGPGIFTGGPVYSTRSSFFVGVMFTGGGGVTFGTGAGTRT